MEEVGVGVTAAAAKEARPAAAAFWFVEDVGFSKIRGNIGGGDAGKDGAKAVPIPADELVAGVEIAVRRHGVVFMARVIEIGRASCRERV